MIAPPKPAPDSLIYFSDFFGISPEILEEYGAFDVALINDLPLFIDPFLLFNSDKAEYKALHERIIKYVSFLRDRSVAGEIDEGLLEHWFTFREIKQNWFGYSKVGNKGRGLGMEFARGLNRNLAKIFQNFGEEDITEGTHIEKVCLIADDVGRDNISDFATNLINGYLLDYTQTFGRKYLRPDQLKIVAVPKSEFNYATQSWVTRAYELPFVNGDFVILTPVDLLTKDDVWINKVDMVRDYSAIAESIPNHALRAQLNNYFALTLQNIERRDREERERRAARAPREGRRTRQRREPRGPSEKQTNEAAMEVIRAFPVFIDWYIRYKELHGDQAEAQADERVRSSERMYVAQVRDLVMSLTKSTPFYRVPETTFDEARKRAMFLKDVIENKDGWRSFWIDGQPVRKEADARIMFRLTWYGTPSDVNTEVNSGRGPADFTVSRGAADKSVVEFKLASNPQLEKNLRSQTKIYQKAGNAQYALTVIIFFTREERERVKAILKAVGREEDKSIILIDARDDNKPSASKAESPDLED